MKEDDPEKRIAELERLQADMGAARSSGGPPPYFGAIGPVGPAGFRRKSLWRRHPWVAFSMVLPLLFLGVPILMWGLSRHARDDARDAWACAHGSTRGIDCSKYTAASTTAPSSAKGQPGHVKVTIEGKDQIAPSDITCFSSQSPPTLDIAVGSNPGIYSISLNDTNPPTVHSLLLNPGGQGFTFDEFTGEGTATVTRVGDSYKITGQVVEHSDLMRALKPFEIEVSCPTGRRDAGAARPT